MIATAASSKSKPNQQSSHRLNHLKQRGIRAWRDVGARLLRFGPRLTNWAIPDGRTLTVAVTDFRHEPQLRLHYGARQIEPTRVSRLSDDPGTGNWQLVFDCPHPDPEGKLALVLSRPGTARPLAAQPSTQAHPDRPVRDASWPDGTRWEQRQPNLASWYPAAASAAVRIAAIEVKPGVIELTATNLPPHESATVVISSQDSTRDEYRITQNDRGVFSVATAALADLASRAGLSGTSNWEVSIHTDAAENKHLRLASRDLINPNTAIVYQPEVALTDSGRVAIKPYWSARGFLRILIECTLEESGIGDAQ